MLVLWNFHVLSLVFIVALKQFAPYIGIRSFFQLSSQQRIIRFVNPELARAIYSYVQVALLTELDCVIGSMCVVSFRWDSK